VCYFKNQLGQFELRAKNRPKQNVQFEDLYFFKIHIFIYECDRIGMRNRTMESKI